MLDHLIEIQKQSTLDKAEGPEEKTITVSKFTEGHELVEVGIRVFEDTGMSSE
jgi:hypothetical protein